ncbi:MAG TPA: hypothetical protein VGR57_12830 [Ktedonobacterales bacterium]|nr:hypothetical protein [Ktedonobacterales bacterium]
MDEDPRQGDGASTAVQTPTPVAAPAAPEWSRTDRALITIIILLGLAAILLLARTTALLLQSDLDATWSSLLVSGRAGFTDRLPGYSLLLLIVVGPFITLIHESAHALGGRLAGFWLASIQVGWVKLTRTKAGVRLGFSKKRWWAGGSTLSYPVGDHHLRLRYAAFVAPGPISDLLVGFLGAAMAHLALAASVPSPLAVEGWEIVAILGFSGFLLDGIPFKLWKARNDGWFLLQVLFGTRSMERSMVFATLLGYTARETPARDRSPAVFARALELASSRAEAHVAAVYAYSYALETGDIAMAARQIDQAIATTAPPGPVKTIAHEVAYFTARYRRHPDAARAWLERAYGDRFLSFMRPRALAAILLMEGRYAEARAQAAEGLVALAAYARSSGRRYREEEQQLRAMLAEAERAQATQAARADQTAPGQPLAPPAPLPSGGAG